MNFGMPYGKIGHSGFAQKSAFWIGIYPGLTKEMLSFVVAKLEAFFGVNF